jgi:signal transduction histidine kinase
MKNLLVATAARVRRCSPVTLVSAAVLYEVVLGLLDYTTPEEMSFTIFYLLGVAFVGYGVGRRPVLPLSALATGIMAIHERNLGQHNETRMALLLWNASTRCLLFWAVGWLTAEITRLNRDLLGLVQARTIELQNEIEKHKATSTQLGEALTRLRAIIARAPIIIFAVNRSRVITFEDGPALSSLGIPAGAHVGQNILTAYPQSAEFGEQVERALAGEEFSALMCVGPVALETWHSPVRESDGTISGCTAVAVNVTERRRLERQILEISDREQAHIGQELHDGLCQQLVSLAFDANSLRDDLASHHLPQAQKTERIADLLDQAITEARQLARGLFPIRLQAEGLFSALEELARTTRQRSKIECRFEAANARPFKGKAAATHLYRIAQEAVSNAIRHSHAKVIRLRLHSPNGQLRLEIEDDGVGLPEARRREASGMGLHIMDYRARAIGARLSFSAGSNGGTRVCCCVPDPLN